MVYTIVQILYNYVNSNKEGSVFTTCGSNKGKLWLDIQDKIPAVALGTSCKYEKEANKVAKFFYSMTSEAGLTATGAYLMSLLPP